MGAVEGDDAVGREFGEPLVGGADFFVEGKRFVFEAIEALCCRFVSFMRAHEPKFWVDVNVKGNVRFKTAGC